MRNEMELTMSTDAETIVRRAYHAAEGNVMDVQGFIDLFADDGAFNAVGQQSFRGEHLGDPVVFMGKLAPDVHRELHRVNVMGSVVAIELSIRAPSPGRSRRQQASSGETEQSSTSRAPTSGTWRTARSSSSTATSAPASCTNKSAYSPTTHPQSKRRPLPSRPQHSPPGGYQRFFNGDPW
jgi:hypothetical protein